MSKWSDPGVQATLASLIESGITYDEVARRLEEQYSQYTFNAEQVRKWWKRVGSQGIVLQDDPTDLYGQSQITSIERIKTVRQAIYHKYSDVDRMLVMSDLHAPYHDTKFIEYSLNEGVRRGCQLCVIGGDVWDQGKFSSYGRSGVPFRAEYEKTRALLKVIRDYMDVVVIYGNHDVRLMRSIRKTSQIDEVDFLLEERNIDPLRTLSREVGFDYAEHWWIQINSVIVSHPFRYSGVHAKNVTNSVDWFLPRIESYWDALVQGHSHAAGSGSYMGKWWFETGCMCLEHDYTNGPRQARPVWTQAFAILEFDDGKLDFNKSSLKIGKRFK